MLVRKAGMLDTGTPRTPFSEVNRQTAYGTDPTRVGLQPKQSVVKPGGKRRSWAPEGMLHRFVGCSLGESFFLGTVHFEPHRFAVLRWYENVCVCVRNELEVCTTSVHSILCQYYIHKYTHTHILKPFEDSEPTGLKVDIASSCFWHLLQHSVSGSDDQWCCLFQLLSMSAAKELGCQQGGSCLSWPHIHVQSLH